MEKLGTKMEFIGLGKRYEYRSSLDLYWWKVLIITRAGYTAAGQETFTKTKEQG